MATQGRGPSIRPRIFAYLDEHKGRTVTCERMALELELSERQVQNAMHAISKKPEVDITILAKGHTWVYNGTRSQSEQLALPDKDLQPSTRRATRKPKTPAGSNKVIRMTVICQIKDGSTLFEDIETGTVWKATKIS